MVCTIYILTAYVGVHPQKQVFICRIYNSSVDSLLHKIMSSIQVYQAVPIAASNTQFLFETLLKFQLVVIHAGIEQSHKWKRLYNQRSRLDRDYKFENHTIRGLKKMKIFLTVTFLVYMGMTKAKIEKGEKKHLCRLYHKPKKTENGIEGGSLRKKTSYPQYLKSSHRS